MFLRKPRLGFVFFSGLITSSLASLKFEISPKENHTDSNVLSDRKTECLLHKITKRATSTNVNTTLFISFKHFIEGLYALKFTKIKNGAERAKKVNANEFRMCLRTEGTLFLRA